MPAKAPHVERALFRPAMLFALGVVSIIVGILALAIDIGVAQFYLDHKDWYWKPFLLAEVFAHGWGVALIFLGVFCLAPDKRIYLPRAMTITFGAGILANVGKLVYARQRPRATDMSQSIYETFRGWLPSMNEIYGEVPSGISRSDWQSIPSSHTATGVALALSLTMLFPQGRYYFLLMAVMAGVQRIITESHFCSDLCWGAAVAFLFAGIVQSPLALGNFFTNLERKWDKTA
jgi:membrane-associated phospholipid phosphatase